MDVRSTGDQQVCATEAGGSDDLGNKEDDAHLTCHLRNHASPSIADLSMAGGLMAEELIDELAMEDDETGQRCKLVRQIRRLRDCGRSLGNKRNPHVDSCVGSLGLLLSQVTCQSMPFPGHMVRGWRILGGIDYWCGCRAVTGLRTRSRYCLQLIREPNRLRNR